ncbi:MAG: RNA-dependent RNA polymerase [Grapevine-associated levi-like virus 10]|uniref:RNA-directed RNA polymerase n=1 Tax=Grapevine-associated levi-like virus 10 TaxID=2814355 RepID=A0A8F5MJB8_9VIRU|nr:MAG: RNA-dependent RNA polymerase [Grapevine-associated levi-like virus 10]
MVDKRNRRQAPLCVNTAASEDLTEQFRERITQFVSCPKALHLKSEIFSKFVSADTDPADVRRERAISKWLSTERDNEATIERLLLTPEDFHILPWVTFGEFVSFCQDLIRKVIGDTAPVDALIGSFSGGASTSRARTESHPAGKYLGIAHITPRCRELFEEVILDEMPAWRGLWDQVSIIEVPGNVLFTVPKKTDIDRCACKEPDINMFVQKGIGNYFRKSLRAIGINLNDQSINRSFAREGSITGMLSTLDLSSASDSISSEVVSLLLPECWFTLLDSVRSPVTIIDGVEHSNQMFSSMGNGFTFELESLLFYALARTTAYFRGTPGVISVYGDDIICPSGIAQDLSEVLSYFGFQVNPDKSFSTGFFRESCGGHYLHGCDITPFYVKAPIKSLLDIIDVANKLRKWSSQEQPNILGYTIEVDHFVEDTWFWLKSKVPSLLWGGEDTSFKYRLVSDDIGAYRVSQETKSRSTGDGGYLHWLNATWARTNTPEDGVVTSKMTTSRERYRLRPVREATVPRLQHYFYKETVVMPSKTDIVSV